MRLNLNDNIKVKLTEHGKDIYYHQYDRTNKLLGREVCKPSYPIIDEDGYTTFQLWCFMELYGVHMGMTLPNVIEPLDIVFDEPTIEARNTGYWLRTGRDNVYGGFEVECSECGDTVMITHIEDELYCRHCGAKMEEGEK